MSSNPPEQPVNPEPATTPDSRMRSIFRKIFKVGGMLGIGAWVLSLVSCGKMPVGLVVLPTVVTAASQTISTLDVDNLYYRVASLRLGLGQSYTFTGRVQKRGAILIRYEDCEESLGFSQESHNHDGLDLFILGAHLSEPVRHVAKQNTIIAYCGTGVTFAVFWPVGVDPDG